MAGFFQILPAIDMKDGKCVRLRQGRAEDETVYADDPVKMARHWVEEGAEYLHLVDLTGAFDGAPAHVDQVLRIVSELKVPVEIGGGIRTDEQIAHYLDNGVDRVIIGTRACDNPGELQKLVERFGSGIAVGIDARDGFVQTRGWTETTSVQAVDLARQMCDIGVKTLIYTDTSRDGMMKGVNAEAMDAMCEAVSCCVIASGGVTLLDDVVALKNLERNNLNGVIVGKALYENTVTLKELLCV